MTAKQKSKLQLTPREEAVMQILWAHGPLSVRDMLAFYPEPRPHFNTVSTQVRMLEERGLVSHEVAEGGGYRYFAVADLAEYRDSSLGNIVRSYFGNSYLAAVSTLVKNEKISVDELRELIRLIDSQSPES